MPPEQNLSRNNTDSEAHSKDITQVIANMLQLKLRPAKYSVRIPELSDSTWEADKLTADFASGKGGGPFKGLLLYTELSALRNGTLKIS